MYNKKVVNKVAKASNEKYTLNTIKNKQKAYNFNYNQKRQFSDTSYSKPKPPPFNGEIILAAIACGTIYKFGYNNNPLNNNGRGCWPK